MNAPPATAVATGIRRELPQRELRLITIIVGLYIVLGEIDRLISRVSSQGYSASMVDASRPRSPIPLPTSESQPWLTLHNVDSSADVFVGVFTVLDCIMAVTYGLLLWTLLRQLTDRKVIGEKSPVRMFTKPRPWLAPVAVAFDILENILLLMIVVYGSPETTMSAGLALLACLTTLAKWAALLLAVTPMLYAVFVTKQGRSWAGRWGRALYRQRFSLVAVVPIAALALVPGPGIFDQIPDVQRAWLEFGDGRGVTGFLHAGVATLVLGVVAFGLFLLGRLFTDDACHRCDDSGVRRPTQLWQWLFGPVVVGLGALALIVTGSAGSIRGRSLFVFCAIPLFVAAFSWWRRRRPGKMEGLPESQSIPVSEVWRVGDMLALTSIVVASLGLVRSFTVLLMLLPDDFRQAENLTLMFLQAGMPALGLISALVAWQFGVRALEWIGRLIPLVSELIQPGEGPGLAPTGGVAVTEADTQPTPQRRMPLGGLVAQLGPAGSQQRRPWRLAWICILGSSASLVALAVFPVGMGGVVGVLGAVMLGLGNLMLLVGASAAVHAMWSPPEIFQTRLLRLRETPVITLLAVAVLVASAGGSTPAIHGLRAFSGGVRTGTSYEDAVRQWEKRTTECFVMAPNGSGARPMLFVAAEGGGIRAAYWTVAVLKVLAEQTGCGIDSMVVASGVSGGAVGLEVARVSPVAGSADAVWGMGGANALSQASIGLLVRDPVSTITGVPPLIDGQWLDRAGLMETVWEAEVHGLAGDFYGPAVEDGLAAPLVLNSTDATSGCRVLVTHLDVSTEVPEEGEEVQRDIPCTDAGAPLTYSRDIRAYMPRDGVELDKDDACLDGLRGSTAAMLAARFPYVTPSGVVGPCGGTPRAQLIDGGYIESSGLGTLVDMAPKLLAEVSEEMTVQPIVVFLDNGRGGDLQTMPPHPRSELMIPPMGALTAGGTQNSTAAWLQRARALSAGANVLEPEVFVVAQGSAPAVEAPLGWVLSQASRDDMDRSLKGHVERACTGQPVVEDPAESKSQGHPNLPELLNRLGAACA